MKTLVIILNHNVSNIADNLYNMLKPYEGDGYDVRILDNGSDVINLPKNTSYRIYNNTFFGGGLNYAFKLILDNKKYDSLLFLNNDLIVHGYNFVKKLREELFDNNLMIVSPSVLDADIGSKNVWRQMHNWSSDKCRIVRWVDFQAPMFNRKFIEYVNQYDDDLKYGWGPDVLSGIICEENNWKIGICDFIPVVHLKEMTFKTRSAKINNKEFTYKDYRRNALNGMISYFKKIGKEHKMSEFRNWSGKYIY